MNIGQIDVRGFSEVARHLDVVVCYKEILADTITPITLLSKFSEYDNMFLLESFEANTRLRARYTYIGLSNTTVRFNSKQELIISKPDSVEEKIHTEEPLKTLDKIFFKKSNKVPVIGDFQGGYVGYFGYESVNYFGTLRKKIKESDKDKFLFMQAEKFITFDNHTGKTYAVIVKEVCCKGEQELAAFYNEVNSELDFFIALSKHNGYTPVRKLYVNKQEVEYTDEEYYEKAKALIEELKRGEALQVVFSRLATVHGYVDPVSFYRLLRYINPSPYMFYIKHKDVVVCGSSPETHLRCVGDKVELRPIAGSRPVTEEDRRNGRVEELCKELLNDAKENSEHLMLLDLARNDLYTSCSVESVTVEESFVPEVYSHIIHIVSLVSGVVDHHKTPSKLDLFARTFPAGTLSGAPKVRAIELIDEYENSTRDFYGGCAGYFSYSGDFDTCIIIRSARITSDRTDYRAGGGLVIYSKLEDEFNEIYRKLGPITQVLGELKNIDMKF